MLIALKFAELLKKDGTFTIQQRNLRTLTIEICKISNDLSPIFMKDIVTESRIPYNTRSTVKVEKDTMETRNVPKNLIMSFQRLKLSPMDLNLLDT